MNRPAIKFPKHQPDLAGAQPALGRSLRRATRLVQATIEARFGVADLNFTQWVALDAIGSAGQVTAGELATAMEITTGALTRVADGLEARSLLSRDRDGDDRRIVQMRLTPAGRAMRDEIRPVATKRWRDVLQSLSADDLKQLSALLNKLNDSIERNALRVRASLVEA